jgi:glycosyltransferase involved in cell wall biosynthesis
MQLGINAKRLTGERTGVGRYVLNLLKAWNQMPLPFERIVVYTFDTLDERVPELSSTFKVANLRTRLPTILLEHPVLASKARGVDLLFSPSNMLPVGYRGKCVVTIHDMIQELFPETFPWWARYRHAPFYRYSAKRADRICTDSENSKRDICKYYEVDPAKVKAIPLAADAIFRPIDDPDAIRELRRRYALGDEPILLFVGKLSKRRHIPNLLQAIKELKMAGDLPHRLVIVGPDHSGVGIERLIEEQRLGGDVAYLRYISDDDLVLLYNAAEVFIYPSDYEGFGLPVLEAMACGTAVITSGNSALVEVTGDTALHLKSASAPDLAEAISALVTNTALRTVLAQRGLERSTMFSWDRTAKETMDLLATVAGAS